MFARKYTNMKNVLAQPTLLYNNSKKFSYTNLNSYINLHNTITWYLFIWKIIFQSNLIVFIKLGRFCRLFLVRFIRNHDYFPLELFSRQLVLYSDPIPCIPCHPPQFLIPLVLKSSLKNSTSPRYIYLYNSQRATRCCKYTGFYLQYHKLFTLPKSTSKQTDWTIF